jgi:SAM-dependent MidA family methyltransferase
MLPSMSWRTWREASFDALYGPGGFFLREAPADHFRTSVASPLFAGAVRRLAGLVDEALGRPDPFDVVDVGAGRGELLSALPDVPGRWRLTGVDLATADVPYGWRAEIPELEGLLFANEWLDDVPLDVLVGGRLVEVAADGTERPGPAATAEQRAWARQWWPDGDRVEVGRPRDLAWAAAVAQVRRGLAVAVDYGHTRADRRPTLTGYRAGRQVPPVPDGSCDLTAHVALDACAAATGARLMTQRAALRLLGICAERPPSELAAIDPRGYLALLQQAGQAGELLDPDRLGGFGWLVRPVGISDPLADPLTDSVR